MGWDLSIIIGLGYKQLVKWVLMDEWVLYIQPNYAHLKLIQTYPFNTPSANRILVHYNGENAWIKNLYSFIQ